jgi:rod shape determining protein RodA
MKPEGSTVVYDGRWERTDWFLLLCAMGLILIGTLTLAGLDEMEAAKPGVANRQKDGTAAPRRTASRQLIYVAIGVALFLAIQKTDYQRLIRLSPWLYVFGLGTLGAVLFTRPINNAHSWFDLHVIRIQPSEFMKPILLLTLANYLMYRKSCRKTTGLFIPVLICLAPMGLILKQPDLGTVMTFVPMLFAVLLAAGTRLRDLCGMALLGGAGLTTMWFTIMKDYQKRRILAWLDPSQYSLNEAWQLLRAETAIGSGGWFGKGAASDLGGLNLLPERHTDFIFAVIAERGGLLLSGVLLALFFLLTLSALGVASRTREPGGRLIAVGIAALLGGQMLLNVAVAVGLLPTTGVTLPFVSYGGSSMLSSFICLGLLINVGAVRAPVLAGGDFPRAEPWRS